MTDICCIGHITKDKIVTPASQVYMPGGTAWYFAQGISHLGGEVSFRLVTALAPPDMEPVHQLRARGVDVTVLPSRSTVFFENTYGHNMDNRQQRVLAKADPFTAAALADVRARYIVLGTLLADDFDLDVLRQLSARGTLVLDAQGYLREVRGERVHAIDWPGKLQALRYVDVLKVNEWEAEVLTGTADQREACRRLASWGVGEVLLTLGSYGSVVYAGGQFHQIPAYEPLTIVDATGCGDTYVMGYVYRRAQGHSPLQSARFAAAVSTIKLESSGPFTATEAAALARLA